MTYCFKMISIFRHGINNDNIGPIAKASFEETPEMFLRAARHAELDLMTGVSSNIMCGQEGYFGTSAFQVYLDLHALRDRESEDIDTSNTSASIEAAFGKIDDPNNPCSKANLTINNNAENIANEDLGVLDDDYDIDF